jgi:hypothetical protein
MIVEEVENDYGAAAASVGALVSKVVGEDMHVLNRK